MFGNTTESIEEIEKEMCGKAIEDIEIEKQKSGATRLGRYS